MFQWVAWSCAVLQLWIHPTLLHILPVPILYALTKLLVDKFDLFNFAVSGRLRQLLVEDLFR